MIDYYYLFRLYKYSYIISWNDLGVVTHKKLNKRQKNTWFTALLTKNISEI